MPKIKLINGVMSSEFKILQLNKTNSLGLSAHLGNSTSLIGIFWTKSSPRSALFIF